MRLTCRVAGLAVLVIAGCGSPNVVPAKVSGVVTYKSAPVPGGSVTFVADNNEKFTSALGTDGSYSITGMPVGDYKVAVETDTVKGSADAAASEKGKSGYAGMTSPRPKGAAPVAEVKYVAIPPKYKNAAGSGLNVTLKKGANTFSPELQ